MLSYSTILTAILPVFLVIGAGFLFQKRGWLGEELETGVMKLGLNLLLPCFILHNIPGNPALEEVSSTGWAMGIGFVLILVGFGAAWTLSRLAGMKRGEGLRTFTLTAGIQNYGFLPIPIVLKLFPEEEGPLSLILVHGLGVELAVWTVGLWILTGHSGWRSLLNGPFLATVFALILNYSGAYQFVPEIVDSFTGMLGACAIPMAIFMIGGTMGRFYDREVFRQADTFRAVIVSCAVRFGLLAAIFIAAAVFLPVSIDLKRVLVVQAAMPAAIYPIVLARLYGGHPPTAIQVALATAAVSIFTAPAVIALGLKWIETGASV